jgi:hypothetical protein
MTYRSLAFSILLQKYMNEMFEEGQSLVKIDQRLDLFSLLVGVNDLEDKQNKLTKAGVIGKWFL